jgi:hypothetical protein
MANDPKQNSGFSEFKPEDLKDPTLWRLNEELAYFHSKLGGLYGEGQQKLLGSPTFQNMELASTPPASEVSPSQVLTKGLADEIYGTSINHLKTVAPVTPVVIHAPSTIVKSPLDYGAVGDGMVDDTTAVQACVNANPAWQVPAGFTFLVGQITVPSAQPYLNVTGSGTLKLKANAGATASILRVVNCRSITIDGPTLDGNRANQTPPSSSGVLSILDCGQVTISNATIKEGSGSNLQIAFDSSNTQTMAPVAITNCDFRKSNQSNLTFTKTSGPNFSSTVTITNCQFGTSGGSGATVIIGANAKATLSDSVLDGSPNYCLDVQNASLVNITSCKFLNFVTGAVIGTNYTAYNCVGLGDVRNPLTVLTDPTFFTLTILQYTSGQDGTLYAQIGLTFTGAAGSDIITIWTVESATTPSINAYTSLSAIKAAAGSANFWWRRPRAGVRLYVALTSDNSTQGVWNPVSGTTPTRFVDIPAYGDAPAMTGVSIETNLIPNTQQTANGVKQFRYRFNYSVNTADANYWYTAIDSKWVDPITGADVPGVSVYVRVFGPRQTGPYDTGWFNYITAVTGRRKWRIYSVPWLPPFSELTPTGSIPNAVEILTPREPSTTGIDGSAVINIPTASFAAGIEPVTIVSVNPVSLVTKNIYNTTDGHLYRWNGVSYVMPMIGADIKAQLNVDQLVAGQIAAGAIQTPQLSATEILVGGSGSNCPRIRVNDIFGSPIAYVGTDSAGFYGLWAVNGKFGGTFANPIISLNSSGATLNNVSIVLLNSLEAVNINPTDGVLVTYRPNPAVVYSQLSYNNLEVGTTLSRFADYGATGADITGTSSVASMSTGSSSTAQVLAGADFTNCIKMSWGSSTGSISCTAASANINFTGSNSFVKADQFRFLNPITEAVALATITTAHTAAMYDSAGTYLGKVPMFF